MRTDRDQYLPNHCTAQVVYTPNPRVLDHRGEWAAQLTKILDLSKWGITENQIGVTNQANTEAAVLAFNNCGITCHDSDSHAYFAIRAKKLLQFICTQSAFGDPLSIQRIGVKCVFFTPYSGSFDDLKRRVKERYVDLHPNAYKAIGDGVTLVDNGAPFVFSDAHGEFHTQCGPMKNEQAHSHFFQEKALDSLPNVGLFFSIDYLQRPNDPVKMDDLIHAVEILAEQGWDRHQRVRKLIVGA